MEPSGSQQLEQPLRIKLEPLEAEPDWPGIAVELDLGPEMLGSVPVKSEPGAPAIKTEAGWPGGPEQTARAGAGLGSWLAAVRLSAADRPAAEAQLPQQQSPALGPVNKEEGYIAPPLGDPLVSAAPAAAAAALIPPLTPTLPHIMHQTGAQSPTEPCHRIQGLGGPGLERSCRQCPARFRSWRQLQQHVAAQHPGSTAPSCTGRGQTLRRSSAQQPMDKPHQCQQCGKGFARLSRLQRHERVHSGERPFVCPDCGAGFKRKDHLQLHSRTHTGEKPHRCTQCGRGFVQLSNLQTHEHMHTRPHACPDCGQRFSQAGHLRAHHQTVHLKQRPHVCSDCGRRFTQAGHMRIHQRAVHLNTMARPYTCSHCGKTFTQLCHLKQHEAAVHLKQRPHACPNCGWRFSQASHLRTHQWRCTSSCSRMSAPTMASSSLTNTASTHSGAPLHVCEVCGQQISQTGTLHRHIFHSGQRLFKCDSCGRSFKHKCALRNHVRIHLTVLGSGPNGPQ